MTTLSPRLGTDRRTRPRAASSALLVLTCAALVYALGVIIFGLVSLATQLSAGVIQPTMTWRSFTFSDNGDGHHGVVISGGGGSVLTSVTGASAGSTTLYVVAALLGLAVQAVLAVLAWRLLRRLREGRPFERAAWRELAVLSAVLLTCGVASQVLEWFTQLAVLADDGGSSTLTAAFRFEPTTVTAGAALALMAVAFHMGERLQRDAAGLV